MKNKKLALLLAIPLIMTGCGKKDEKKPSGSNEIDGTFLSLASMSDDELAKAFGLKDDSSTIKYEYEEIIKITDKSFTNFKESKTITRDGNKFKVVEESGDIQKRHKSEAVSYINENNAPSPAVTEDTVEAFLQSLAESMGCTLTDDSEYYLLDFGIDKDEPYYFEYKFGETLVDTYRKEMPTDENYKKVRTYNDYPYEYYFNSGFLNLTLLIKDLTLLFDYNSDAKQFDLKPAELNGDKHFYFDMDVTKGSMSFKNSKLDKIYIEFESGKLNISADYSSKEVILPTNLDICDHKYGEDYYQIESDADGKYYHIHECSECGDINFIEECKFEEHSYCEICEWSPADYYEIFDDNDEVLVQITYSSITNEIFYLTLAYGLYPCYYDASKEIHIGGENVIPEGYKVKEGGVEVCENTDGYKIGLLDLEGVEDDTKEAFVILFDVNIVEDSTAVIITPMSAVTYYVGAQFQA